MLTIGVNKEEQSCLLYHHVDTTTIVLLNTKKSSKVSKHIINNNNRVSESHLDAHMVSECECAIYYLLPNHTQVTLHYWRKLMTYT